MILMGNFAGVVFGKAMLAMALYVWTRSWWSLGERLLFTCATSASLRPWDNLKLMLACGRYEALLCVPWVLLLDHWNLIFWKY